MAIREELTLGIQNFQANLDRARADVRKTAGEMSRDMRNVGGGPGGAGGAGGGIGGAMASGISKLVPAIGVGMILSEVKALIDRAGDIDDLAIKLGETAEAVQRVDHAAKIAGSGGVEQVGNAMIRLEKNLGAVGNERATAALERLGLSAGTLMGMPLDEKILALSEAFQTARKEGTGVPDLLDLLGRSGAELIPILSMARGELEGLFANAPALTQHQIVEMTKMGDAVDTTWAKMKNNWSSHIASMGERWAWFKDYVETASIEQADLRMADRNTASTKSIYDRMDAKTAQGEAVAEQQRAAEAAAEEAAAADDLATALERVAKIKESIADKEMAGMSTADQITEIERRRAELFAGSIGNFPFFEQSAEGLRALAESRDNTPNLPNEGMNSAAEAWGWVRQALELSEKQRTLESKINRDEEAYEKSAFSRLDPEAQMESLRDRIAESLGIDAVGSTAEIEAGAEALAKRGKFAEATDVLSDLGSLEAIAGRQGGPRAPTSAGQGSLATLMDEIFGRTPGELQLEEARRAAEATEKTSIILDKILIKMDEPPDASVFSDGSYGY
jgi:hypothetical protein